jgi:hypothetical protein
MYGLFSDIKSIDGSELGRPLWSNVAFGRATVQILAIRAIDDKAPITIQKSLCMFSVRALMGRSYLDADAPRLLSADVGNFLC